MNSHNGIYVNGQRVTSKLLTEQISSASGTHFRLKEGELRQFVDDGQVTFTARTSW